MAALAPLSPVVFLESDNDTALTDSNRAGGSATARTALVRLEELLHDGYNGIAAIRSSTITDAKRLEVFTAYVWASGNLGKFNDARILGLARLALDDDLDIDKPEWKYSADLQAEIQAQLDIFEANADDRTEGNGWTRRRSETRRWSYSRKASPGRGIIFVPPRMMWTSPPNCAGRGSRCGRIERRRALATRRQVRRRNLRRARRRAAAKSTAGALARRPLRDCEILCRLRGSG